MNTKESEIVNSLGGDDRDDWGEYIQNDLLNGCLQLPHLSRSIIHQPNHLKFGLIKELINNNFIDLKCQKCNF